MLSCSLRLLRCVLACLGPCVPASLRPCVLASLRPCVTRCSYVDEKVLLNTRVLPFMVCDFNLVQVLRDKRLEALGFVCSYTMERVLIYLFIFLVCGCYAVVETPLQSDSLIDRWCVVVHFGNSDDQYAHNQTILNLVSSTGT